MKRKAFLWILIALISFTTVWTNTYKPPKEEIPLPVKEEKELAVSVALPEDAEEIKEEETAQPPASLPKAQIKPRQPESGKEALPPAPPPDGEVQETLLPESEESELFCTLTVRCDDVLENMEKLSDEKHGIIPESGFIFPKEKVIFTEDESVFDVLLRVMREHHIHMDFVDTPIYNSVYIKGIGNLYEFDCGDTSGWIYTVNGESPMHGSSQHKVKQGDNIEFKYICSLY